VRGQKRIEEALKESEERYRAVVEQSVEAIYLYDAETKRVLESNAAFGEMIGYTEEELLGMCIYDFIEHAVEDIDRNVRSSLEAGRRHIGERRYRRKDGSVMIVDTSASVISYGGKTALCAVSRDVTERRRFEEALKESEERFRSLVQNASDLITILEVDGTVRYDSPAIERMLGYGPEERVGSSTFDYIHPEDVARVKRTFSETVDEYGVQPPVEFRMRHKDGSWRYIETTRSNLLDQPAVRGVVSNARDVTERKEAERALRESEARFRAVFGRAAIGMALVNAEGRLMESNPALQEMLGYGDEELRGMHFADLTHPEDVAADAASFEELVAGDLDRFRMEKRYIRKDGSLLWGGLTSSSVPGTGGGPWFMVGMVEDITERKEAERALRESEERYRAVVERSVEAIYLFDPETKQVLETNAAFENLLGYSADELLEMKIYDFVAHDVEDIDLNVQRHLIEEKRFVGERKYHRKDGRLLEVAVSATLVPYDGQESVCCVVRDVTERKALEEQLARQAFHDSLTDLPNRALFLDRLGHTLARARRGDGHAAVLFVDLDDFKIVNDSLGHESGDLLLAEVAGRLRSCVRPGDTVARLFGDEFAVLLESPAAGDEAQMVAVRVLERLQAPFELDGREIYASASIGITDCVPVRDTDQDPHQERPEDVLRRADLAMYTAKRRGKNGYEVFSPSMNTRVFERMEVENQLRRAVEREEFVVHYQPIIDLNTGTAWGVEALARWRHPERGLIVAEEFAQIVEETGLIRPVGRRVFEEACRKAKEWREQYPDRPLLMSVNFSASQFVHQADLIPKVLNETGLDPRTLVIEITERAVMDDAEFALGKLQRMKDLGVSFIIDDYGTGYSCLQYLKLMPVDSLKIDGSFIAGLGRDWGDTAIVSGTIDLAHALELTVVAEGVETAGQLERLRELGCDLVQGYYLSEPLAEGEIRELLAADPRRWPYRRPSHGTNDQEY
jgi:diguanylate cyclase (GGDEF)-like protein/PAS domain S-box-containing protein